MILFTMFMAGLIIGFVIHSFLYAVIKDDEVDKAKYYFLRKWIRTKHPKVNLPKVAAKTTEEVKEIEKKLTD